MATILVVDDEATVKESLSLALGKKGYHIDTAINGLDAMNYIHDKCYDLVLTDIRMPEMDGMQLVHTIRQEGRDTPVIILSAYVSEKTRLLSEKADVDAILNKPFELNHLYQSIEMALQNKENKENPAKQPINIKASLNQIHLLNSISDKIRDVNNRKRLMERLCVLLHDTYQADRVVVEHFSLWAHQHVMHHDYSEYKEIPENRLIFEKWLIENVRHNNKAILIESIDDNRLLKKRFELEEGSVIAIPLKNEKQLLGVLVLYRNSHIPALNQDDLNALSLFSEQLALKFEKIEKQDEMTTYLTDAIHSLFTTLEAKHYLTFTHAARVACYAMALAKKLDLPAKNQRDLEYLSLLHDIGKIGLPVQLLDRAEPYMEDEREMIERHVKIGEDVLRPMTFLKNGDKVVRAHHEHFDGSGYPDGLKGQAIPLFARIIFIVDTFDHLTTSTEADVRLEHTDAIEKMKAMSGTLFDPQLFDYFVEAYKEIISKQNK